MSPEQIQPAASEYSSYFRLTSWPVCLLGSPDQKWGLCDGWAALFFPIHLPTIFAWSRLHSREALVWEKSWRKAYCHVVPAWRTRDQEHRAEGCSTWLPSSHLSQMEGWEGGSWVQLSRGYGWWKGWLLSCCISSLGLWEGESAAEINTARGHSILSC